MRLAVAPRRFRLGDEKEAAGGAAAVKQMGIMDIECGFLIRQMVFGVRSSRMELEKGAAFRALFAIEPLESEAERGFRAIEHAGHTVQRRRAWSKPAERIGRGDHEESTLARWSCAAVKR